MKDHILLVEHEDEAAKLGWTCLGRVDCKGAWQDVAWAWCKEGTFALLTRARLGGFGVSRDMKPLHARA